MLWVVRSGMSYPISLLAASVLAYIIGATPVGFMAGRMKGIDIRDHGSGNIGATNVLRTLGKGIGIPVFILDVLKGVVPVLLGRWICSGAIDPEDTHRGTLEALSAAVPGMAAILGHNFTFWLGWVSGAARGSRLPRVPSLPSCRFRCSWDSSSG